MYYLLSIIKKVKKNFAEKIARRSLEAGRSAAGRPALAARLQGDRLSHPYIRVGWSPPPLYKLLAAPHPLICLTKNLEKKKREGGRERRGEGEAKRRSPVGFSSRRL